MAEKVQFGDMKEPVNVRYINNAGIYRNVSLTKAVYVPADDAKKLSGYFHEVFESAAGEIYENRYWEIPADEKDIKFLSKLYDKDGNEIRDLTPAEQMQKDYEKFAYHLIQLGMALKCKFDDVKTKVTAQADFKSMCNAFTEQVYAKNKDNKIEFKVLWNNNDKKKTSFMGIPDAGYRNVVFLPYDASKPNSELTISPYEQKKMVRKYFPTNTAPAGDNAEVAGGGGGFKPLDTGDGASATEDLF